MPHRPPLASHARVVSVAAVLLLVACSGATTTIGDGDPLDGGSSGSSGASGTSGDAASADGSGGSSGTSGTSGTSGATDAGASSGDAGPVGRVEAKILITQLAEKCKQPVASDPVAMLGTLTLTNASAVTIGPGAVVSGAFLVSPGGALAASYNFDNNGFPAIAPGNSTTINLVKTAGSLTPQNPTRDCVVIQCAQPYIVEIGLAGTGIASGTTLRTNPLGVTCTN